MGTRWYAVLSQNRARIFEEKKVGSVLKKIKTLDNEIGRERPRNLAKHSPGITKNRFGRGSQKHVMAGKKDWHDDSAKQFARAIVTYLDEQRKLDKFEELIVCAEPRFLGRFKEAISKTTEKRVKEWVRKDFDKLPDTQLPKVLGTAPLNKRRVPTDKDLLED